MQGRRYLSDIWGSGTSDLSEVTPSKGQGYDLT